MTHKLSRGQEVWPVSGCGCRRWCWRWSSRLLCGWTLCCCSANAGDMAMPNSSEPPEEGDTVKNYRVIDFVSKISTSFWCKGQVSELIQQKLQVNQLCQFSTLSLCNGPHTQERQWKLQGDWLSAQIPKLAFNDGLPLTGNYRWNYRVINLTQHRSESTLCDSTNTYCEP